MPTPPNWEEAHRNSQRVDADELAAFTASLFVASGMGEADSQTMARILVEQDCCGGGMSHGTACVGGRKYPRHIAARDVNPRPNITVVMVAVGGSSAFRVSEATLKYILYSS
jgi:LDH2 family malate/lactate/ureidoglycolate dehydrogenase